MSDDSLMLAIEYHREILSGMLSEREQRKNKFMHRYAGVTYTPPVDAATTTSTTVKKTKTISSNKAAATASGLMQAMLAQGWTIEKIQALMEKVSKKI